MPDIDTWQISRFQMDDLTSDRDFAPNSEHSDSALSESESMDPDRMDSEPSEATIVYAAGRSLILRNYATSTLAEPWVWIAGGTFVFLVAWLFPPKLYEQYFGDSSRMFLDLRMFGFSVGCIALTVCGLWCGFGGSLRYVKGRVIAGTNLQHASVTRISLLLLMILCNCLSAAIFVHHGGINAISASLRGEAVLNRGMREIVESSGGSSWVALLMMPSLFAPLAFQMFRSDRKAKWTRILIVVFFLTFVGAAVMASRRNLLARPLFGIVLVYLVWPSSPRMSQERAIYVLGGAAIVMLTAFMLLAGLRSKFSDPVKLAVEPIRYLVTPYNTQAMMQSEEIVLPGAHKGYYWTEWIWQFPGISGLLNLESRRAKLFGEKSPTGVWERGPIFEANGIKASTAIPAFASSWHDFGWLGMLPFFLVGALGAWSWRGFLNGSAGHLILYQTIAYSFLEWRANLLFPSILTDYAFVLVLLIYFGLLLEDQGARPHVSMRSA